MKTLKKSEKYTDSKKHPNHSKFACEYAKREKLADILKRVNKRNLLFVLVFITFYEHISCSVMLNLNNIKESGLDLYTFLSPPVLRRDLILLVSLFIVICVVPIYFLMKYKNLSSKASAAKVFDNPVYFLSGLVICSFILQVYLLGGIYDGFSFAGDEHAYLFQAKLFSGGNITVPSHPLRAFFDIDHIVNNGRMFSIYPPGVPFLLAIGILFGAPFLLSPLFASLSLLIFYKIFRFHYSPPIAFFSTLSICFSRFFINFGASYHSHGFTLFFLALSVFFYIKLEDGQSDFLCLGLGMAIGAAFLMRPFSAVLFCVYFFAAFFLKLVKNGELGSFLLSSGCVRGALFLFLGFLPFMLVFFVYNYHLTGNALKMGYLVSEDIQFIRFQDNFILGIKNIVYALWRLLDALFPIPGGGGVFFTVLGIYRAKRRGYFYLFLLGLFAHSTLYFHQFRYFYSFSFFLHVYTVLGVEFFITKLMDYKVSGGGAKLCLQWFASVMLLCGLMKLSNGVVEKKRRIRRVTAPYRAVRQAGISDAIVFIRNTKRVHPKFYTRNSPDYSASILYAVDMGKDNYKLINYYKERKAYVYDNGKLYLIAKKQ